MPNTARRLLFPIVGWLVLASRVSAQPEPERFDVVLANATIHTGDGAEPFTGHVAIRGDRIAAVTTDSLPEADVRIDCSGLIVCPGFIDLHNHSDEPILDRNTRANVNYLLQGCTTVVTGNCGFGPVDVAKYFGAIDHTFAVYDGQATGSLAGLSIRKTQP